MKGAYLQSHLRAHHLDGGNFYDDFRIDVEKAHRDFDSTVSSKRPLRSGRFRNFFRLAFARVEVALGLSEFFVTTGIRRKWFLEFDRYWTNFLSGRTLFGNLNFFLLLHDYRVRAQQHKVLEWGSPKQHLANWQDSSQFHSLLHMVSKMALRSTRNLFLPSTWKYFPRRANILEYGCSAAPYYSFFRTFYGHRRWDWVLADIPNFAFHFAKYTYGSDPRVRFATIYADNFGDPLSSEEVFDVIIVKEVFEHLDDPVFTADYLLRRLRTGGILIFDYVKSDGTGLDHPRALEDRQDTLRLIASQCDFEKGSLDNPDSSLGLSIARKVRG